MHNDHAQPEDPGETPQSNAADPGDESSLTQPRGPAPGAFASPGSSPRSGAPSLETYKRLAYQSQVVLVLGKMLLGAGASAYRVKSTMDRVAHRIGIAGHQSMVTMNEIVATAYGAGTFRTEVVENRGGGVNNDLIDRVNRYVATLEEGALAEDVEASLKEISSRRPIYGPWVSSLASGAACAGFSFLNSGGLLQVIVVFIAAFFGQRLRAFLLSRKYNHFGVWMLCAAFAAIAYMGIIEIYEAVFHVDPLHRGGVVAAILFLVPGVPLVTSVIELVREDFSAAVPRFAYAFALIVGAGSALWIVTAAFNWSLSGDVAPTLAEHDLLFLQFIASFVAAAGFAMLFKTPWKACVLAALIGGGINVLRLWLISIGWSRPLMTAAAAIAIGLFAAAGSSFTRYSRVSLSVPGAVIMIPGVYLYQALADLNDGQISPAMESMAVAAFAISAIGFGLAIARMLTDHNWRVAPAGAMPDVERIPKPNL